MNNKGNVEYLKSAGVDVDHGLELLGDIETYNSIMEEFLDAFDDRMKRINDYKNNGDLENYQIEVHSLKSDSKYLGFMNLADIAYKHEMASKNNDSNTINNTYNDLLTEASKVINVVKAYLGKNNSSTSNNDLSNGNQNFDSTGNSSKKIILIADDSSIIRSFVEEIFKDEYDVVGAKTGREVADIVAKNLNNIAVLLLDLNMPDINGFQVLEWFKQNDLFKKIPVSVITGASDKTSIDKAFTYPICDVLNKPFEKETVKDIVEKTLNFNNNVNEA